MECLAIPFSTSFCTMPSIFERTCGASCGFCVKNCFNVSSFRSLSFVSCSLSRLLNSMKYYP